MWESENHNLTRYLRELKPPIVLPGNSPPRAGTQWHGPYGRALFMTRCPLLGLHMNG